MALPDDFWQKYELEKQEKAREAKNEAFFFMAEFTAEGIKSVHIEFNGSGDDGSIEVVTIDGVDKTPQWNSDYSYSKMKSKDPLADRLIDWAYKFLDGTGVDWVNNEGGFGTLDFDVPNRTFKFEVNENIQESRIAAEGEWEYGNDGKVKDEDEQPSTPEADSATS